MNTEGCLLYEGTGNFINNPLPAIDNNSCLHSHLLMHICSLYCKQNGPRSDCSLRTRCCDIYGKMVLRLLKIMLIWAILRACLSICNIDSENLLIKS